MKIMLVVIDSFGIGELPDAHDFGDEGSNTYINVLKETNVDLVNMKSLGLNNIEGLNLSTETFIDGCFARMKEKTHAKDTTAGHYEMAGIILENPYPTFPNGFPRHLINELEKVCESRFIGNEVASGTEIIERLGEEHVKTGKPIIYTSADSVLQIASHVDVIPLKRLYEMCQKARELLTGKWSVGRVIARPFAGKIGKFYRTQDRHDYALDPPCETMLDKLKKNGKEVVAVGKIASIFNGNGVTKSYPTKNNHEGLAMITKLSSQKIDGLVFANLCDTDMLYGHRNDINGYAIALKEIDDYIPKILTNLHEDDIFLLTADHGCDPSTPSTDHSREYVPLMVFGKKLKKGIDLGTLYGFDNISNAILSNFGIEKNKDNFLEKCKEKK